MKIHFYIILIITLASCSTRTPNEVNDVIKKAGRNRKELKKVIEHYKETGEVEKLKAAFFLIGNMQDKYGITYPADANFFDLLQDVDSLRKLNSGSDKIDNYIEEEWTKHLIDDFKNMPRQKVKDIDIITADYLIENIDLAFKVWKEKPWCKHLNFDEFCEWILPYRVNDEPLQNWRKYMVDKLSWLDDSLNDPTDAREACLKLNEFIARDFQFSHQLFFVPMLGGVDSWNNRQGLCEHRYQLIIMAMRSIGIPVTIDFTPHYPHEAGSHAWTVLFDSDRQIKTFNGGEKDVVMFNPPICPIGIEETVYVSTVFRNHFAKNKDALVYQAKSRDIPQLFNNPFLSDVSEAYTGVEKSDIPFEFEDLDKSIGFAFLFTFSTGPGLVAVAYTKVKNNKAVFKNIGRRGIYMPGYIKNDQIILLSNPVDLPPGTNDIIPIVPDESRLQHVKLYRKFMVKYVMKGFIRDMQGAKIQGANSRNFSDAQTLFTIDTMISFYDRFPVSQDKPCRYYRYLSTDSGDIRLAELAFIAGDDKGQPNKLKGNLFGYNSNPKSEDDAIVGNAFDDKIETNYNAPAGSWIAQDAGKPVILSSFEILPRNNLNIVVPGDTYALLYFKNGWQFIDQKVATDYFVEFDNVPERAILLLRNLSRGSEERIFFYEDGHQKWR